MKGLLLLSGGIDSPVAGHLMVAKGYDVTGIHLNNFDKENKKMKQIAEKLGIDFIDYHFRKYQEEMDRCEPGFRCILCKRMMLRIAEKQGYDYLITGDNLGQVASQTLSNMYVIDQAVKIPIVRPLIFHDKKDIIDIARKIGTYELSNLPEPACPFVPKSPKTRSKLETVEKEESKLTFPSL